ncbi:unnamed protein product [Knipowitschia caucasica]|uniref:Nrg3 n=1 Tax=Knipowitschia caucasica TaxID=637954 RepID=A0AAV2JPQ3_KNICA
MSRNGRHQGRMSDSAVAGSGVVVLEETGETVERAASGESQNRERAPFGRAFWPRQQTWLCAVPLLIGFIGLGLSLMLLKWIVVGTVRDYVPTDLVDANRIGQDPIFLSKPSGIPKNADSSTVTTSTTSTTTAAAEAKPAGRGRTRYTATTVSHRGGGAYGSQVTHRNPGNRNGRHGYTTTTAAASPVGGSSASTSPPNPTVLHDQTAMWTPEHTTPPPRTTEAPGKASTTTRSHGGHKTRKSE